MRRLFWVILAAFALWSLWWFIAFSGLRNGVTAWMDARVAEGWQAETGEISGGGYPFILEARLTDLALADPETGLAIKTDHLLITATAWWPGFVDVSIDENPISIASPNGSSELLMESGLIKAHLRPGTMLEVQNLSWTSGAWAVNNQNGPQATAQDLLLSMTQVNGSTYSFEGQAGDFSPGSGLPMGFEFPDGFPSTFETLSLNGTIAFDRPWDRRALSERRPQPREIDLRLAEARWGKLSLKLSADITVDEAGLPTGEFSIQAENWQTMLDISETSGILPSDFRSQVESFLTVLARASGNEATLDVDLTIDNGLVLIGFIPVAQAPRLVLR